MDEHKSCNEGVCKLCVEYKQLVKSHIVPQFLYKRVRDNNHKILKANISKSWVYMNYGGDTERLFCEDCEKIIKRYEDYFYEVWYKNSVIPSIIETENIHIEVDSQLFLLFHFSILFRMSISSLSFFGAVDLGEKNNENIRKMLLNQCFSNNNFLLSGVLIQKDLKMYDKIIASPEAYKRDGHRLYSCVYAGGEWLFKISNQRFKEFEEIAFNYDATLGVRHYSETECVKKLAKLSKEFDEI